NAPGATITPLAGAAGARTLSVELDNQGTLSPIPTQGLTLGRAGAAHTNSGSIAVSSGTFTVTQSGTTPSFTNTGTITIASGRSWTVTGGTLLNAATPAIGTIEGPGSLSVSGTAYTNAG